MDVRQRLRVVLTMGIALILVLITGGYGLWLMRAASTGHLMDPAHMRDQDHQMGPSMEHTMMGPASSRGILGGYLGALTALMGLVFLVLVAILAWLLMHERPGRPRQALCPVCGATVETDWTTCAYCGSALTPVGAGAAKGRWVMPYRVVVLGGSFAGLTAAFDLKRMLGSHVDVTVVSRSERVWFIPSLIWVPFGHAGSPR